MSQLTYWAHGIWKSGAAIEAVFRESGVVRSDPVLTEDLALRLIAVQPNGSDDLDAAPVVAVTGGGQAVTLRRRVPLTLLRLLAADRSIVISAHGRADAALRE